MDIKQGVHSPFYLCGFFAPLHMSLFKKKPTLPSSPASDDECGDDNAHHHFIMAAKETPRSSCTAELQGL